uniref:Uncharacterized protein n=1 Tax=Eutreptiella gymnastica TaxID=73025 RepID=A0A7S1IKL4_9EUGL
MVYVNHEPNEPLNPAWPWSAMLRTKAHAHVPQVPRVQPDPCHNSGDGGAGDSPSDCLFDAPSSVLRATPDFARHSLFQHHLGLGSWTSVQNLQQKTRNQKGADNQRLPPLVLMRLSALGRATLTAKICATGDIMRMGSQKSIEWRLRAHFRALQTISNVALWTSL